MKARSVVILSTSWIWLWSQCRSCPWEWSEFQDHTRHCCHFSLKYMFLFFIFKTHMYDYCFYYVLPAGPVQFLWSRFSGCWECWDLSEPSTEPKDWRYKTCIDCPAQKNYVYRQSVRYLNWKFCIELHLVCRWLINEYIYNNFHAFMNKCQYSISVELTKTSVWFNPPPPPPVLLRNNWQLLQQQSLIILQSGTSQNCSSYKTFTVPVNNISHA